MKNVQEKKTVLKLTEAECIKLEKELEKLSEALGNLRNRKRRMDSENEWYINEDGDYGVEEKLIIAEIDKVKRILNSAVVVESKEKGDSIVDLNDVVELNMIFGEDDQERMLVRLGTVRKTNTLDDIEVISIESPLGKAIYKQEVGNTVSYLANGVPFQAEILGKVNQNVEEVETKRTK